MMAMAVTSRSSPAGCSTSSRPAGWCRRGRARLAAAAAVGPRRRRGRVFRDDVPGLAPPAVGGSSASSCGSPPSRSTSRRTSRDLATTLRHARPGPTGSCSPRTTRTGTSTHPVTALRAAPGRRPASRSWARNAAALYGVDPAGGTPRDAPRRRASTPTPTSPQASLADLDAVPGPPTGATTSRVPRCALDPTQAGAYPPRPPGRPRRPPTWRPCVPRCSTRPPPAGRPSTWRS